MLRYYFLLALVGVRRSPWLVVLIIISMGVGVATCMTVVTWRHALSLDPIPQKSHRLFNLQDPAAPYNSGGYFTYDTLRKLRHVDPQNAEAVLMAGAVGDLSREDDSSHLYGVGVRYATSNFFRVFDVPLLEGRAWTSEEAQEGTPVAVIRRDVAEKYFPGSSPLGRRIHVGKTLFTIIGVTGAWNPQPRYYDLSSAAGAFGGGGDAVFVPETAIRYAPDNLMVSMTCHSRNQAQNDSPPEPSSLLDSSCEWLTIWYLVDHRDLPRLRRALKNQLPDLLRASRTRKLRLLDVPQILAAADIVPGSVHLYVLLGLFFLLLCVVNASGMQLSRLMRHAPQIGIRRALGASRGDIVQQYLCDALLIGVLGGLLGIALTFAGLYGLRHIPERYVSYAHMARMDSGMFAAMLLLVLVCSMLAGVIPAWMASRSDPATVIKAAQ
jgi:putative ABC transport system permease protein